VWLYLFDLLYLDHYDTRQVPLRYRKEVLRNTSHFQMCCSSRGKKPCRPITRLG
jgi:hypothetical protein